MKTILPIRSLIFLSLTICALAGDEPSSFDKFLEDHGIVVRQSLANKNFNNEPAAISWISPQGGADSTTIDIAIGMNAKEGSFTGGSWNLLPKVEYHKNTDTGSKQDTLKAGFNMTCIFEDPTPPPGQQVWSHYLELSAAYKDDRIKTGQGISGSLSYTPLYAPLHFASYGTGNFRYMLTPRIALLAEHANDLTAGALSGSVTRLKASVELSVYPFFKTHADGIEVLVGYQTWFNQSRSGPFASDKKHQELFTASLNFYLDRDQRYALGLDYTHGENPEDGQADQTVTSLSFKMKLGGKK